MSFVKPRLSEKSFALSQANNTYALDVPAELNKHEVAKVVAKHFEVEVARVRLINHKGKQKRVINLTGKRSSNQKGSQNDIKKAYITLKLGSHLPFFEAEEKEAKAAAKTKKTEAKEADKSSQKKSVVQRLRGKTKKEAK